MLDSNSLNKEEYFNSFGSLIESLKQNEKKELEELEKIFTSIELYNNLNFQDIITYMLYCFETIELTGKWKLKKSINYSIFINNMDDIYSAIFCNVTTTFKNKVIAATSFENIIEKTISYNIESQIEPVLSDFFKCLSEKHFHTKDTDLTLLRGNIYCAIYNIIKDNSDINEICRKYSPLISEVFDYKRYMNGAITYYTNLINHEEISYLEMTNYLLFKTYNNFTIESKDLKKIIGIIYKKYSNNYFDKKLFIYIFKSLINDLSNNNINIEVVFEDKDMTGNILYMNYNKIYYNFNNNLSLLKNIFNIVQNQKIENDEIDYINLLKIKNSLIEDKDFIYGYKNMLDYNTLLNLNRYLGESNNLDTYEYFDKLIVDCKENKKKCILSDDEIFQEKYDSSQIKELEEKYPILTLEYDESGLYKNVATLIKEKLKIMKSSDENNTDIQDTINIYDNLIKYRNCNFSSLLNDYYSLLLIDTIDSNLIKEKEYVLKEILPKLVEQQLKFSGKLSNKKLDEIYKDYIDPCIKKISQNRVNNKNYDSTKDFLNFEKSNSDNYFGICKLQEILKNSK